MKLHFLPHRFVFKTSHEAPKEIIAAGARPLEQKGSLQAVAAVAKERGLRMIETAIPRPEEPKKYTDIDVKNQDTPFPPETLKKKTKGYPEVKPLNAEEKGIVSALEKSFKKNRKGEEMTHGDVQSAIFVDDEDEKGYEYVLLCDKSQKPVTRLFKSRDRISSSK